MKVKYILDKGNLFIYLLGELDECSAVKTRDTIDKVIEESKSVSRVVFNLAGLTFMDSTGIGMLIGRYKKLKGKSILVNIENPTPSVEKIIQISGLYKIMPKI